MRNRAIFCYYYLKEKVRSLQKKQYIDISDYLRNKKTIAGRELISISAVNEYIYRAIQEGKPLFVGRMGGNELSAMKMYDFEVKSKYRKVMTYLCNNAGFFPNEDEAGKRFALMLRESIKNIDLSGTMLQPFEEYYFQKNASLDMKFANLYDLEPWKYPQRPWTAALTGKKILVIHPLAKLIGQQYQRREMIFPKTDILPEFELQTLKAVQTVAGMQDDRFETWFDALEWMYEESMNIDFDVAIIGCGAYGFPLASRIKRAGKQAIHLGGATQLLFGIKGKRWEEQRIFAYVQKYFNDAWVYPDSEDRPANAEIVEGGCYW